MNAPGYRLVPLPNGVTGLYSERHHEMFHPAIGPAAEGDSLYVRQLQLPERIPAVRQPFVLWDVGLGAAGNPIAVLHALPHCPADLTIVSFDQTAEALRFALRHLHALPSLAPFAGPMHHLLDQGQASFAAGSLRVTWQLILGDFPALLHTPAAQRLPPPDAICWDPHSPKRNPDMWTLPLFADVFAILSPDRPCLLATYSRSTLVRTSLLLAGFFVGTGEAVGAKEETTLAANHRTLLSRPFDQNWLDRVRRSASAEPLRTPAYVQGPLHPDTLTQLLAHPQFAPTSPEPRPPTCR